MIVLMNSAMMPAEGTYTLRRISRALFAHLVAKAHQRSELVSYIGYPETAQHIERISGVPIAISREQTRLDGPTTLLVCKLSYRVADPGSKGKLQPTDGDFEYFVADYVPLQ